MFFFQQKKFLISSFFFVAHWAFAQKDTLQNLPTVEISSLRPTTYAIGQVKLEANQQTTTILQQQSLQDFLQIATPLSFRSYGTGAAFISARGTSARHSALLWNGINIQNGLTGVLDLPTFEIGSGGRLSVHLGASTALFGSGAMGATLLFDNEKPQQIGLQSELNVGTGSFDYQQLSANFKYKKRFFAGETRLSNQHSTNNFEFKNVTEFGKPLQRAENAAFNRFNFTQHFYLNIKENQFLKIHFWHSQNYRENTPTMIARNDKAVLRDTATRIMAEWSGFFKKNIVKARIAWSDDNNNYESDVVTKSQNRIQTLVNEVEINHNFSSKYNFRVAANFTREQSLSSNFSQNQTRNRWAILWNQNFFPNEKTRFSLNARQEITDKKVVPFTFSLGGERALFSAKAVNVKLRAAFSRIYNLPALNDLYWEVLGNPNLLPEQGWSKEIGISTDGGNEQQTWKTHITFFHLNLKNHLLWLPQNGLWKPNNLNLMRSYGLEFMASYSYKKGAWIFGVSPQYQLANARANSEPNQLIFIPVHNANTSFSVQYKNISLLWQQSVSSRRTMPDGFTKPFSLANLNLIFLTKYKKITPVFAFRVLNLFNNDYQVMQYFPNPRRNFKADITLKF